MEAARKKLLFMPGARIPTVPGAAVKFGSNSYFDQPAAFGDPLSFTFFTWFMIPTGITTPGCLFSSGSIINEDSEEYAGLQVYFAPQSGSPSALCTIYFSAYSFDGLNQVEKIFATCRNLGNTASTYPIQRDTWYALYISSNFDDGNASEFSLSPNGAVPSVTTWYGDTPPAFPITPFLPITKTGPQAYQMGITYSLGGAEANCENGYESVNAFVSRSASPILVSAINLYQPWADGNVSDPLGSGHLRFITGSSYRRDFGANGKLPFSYVPAVYMSGDASTFNNIGTNGPYTANGAALTNVNGPL